MSAPAGPGGRGGVVGSYRVTAVERTTESGEVVEPFGRDPDGILVYTPEGTMTAVVGASRRAPLELDLLAGTAPATDEALAQAFRSAHGFAGTYTLGDGVITHHIVVSTVPNWVGTAQVRPFELEGDLLTLRPPGWRLAARRVTAADLVSGPTS